MYNQCQSKQESVKKSSKKSSQRLILCSTSTTKKHSLAQGIVKSISNFQPQNKCQSKEMMLKNPIANVLEDVPAERNDLIVGFGDGDKSSESSTITEPGIVHENLVLLNSKLDQLIETVKKP